MFMRSRCLLPFTFLLCIALSATAEDPVSPHLSLKDLHGNTVTLDSYRGKIVVLNFWATWCGPCTHEMPMLADIARQYTDKNVVVLGVSIDDAQTQSKIEPFVKKRKIEFPILVGGVPDTLKDFDLGIALPATAFIAPDGSIPFRVLGEIKKKELLERLEWMMPEGNHTGTQPKPLVNNFK